MYFIRSQVTGMLCDGYNPPYVAHPSRSPAERAAKAAVANIEERRIQELSARGAFPASPRPPLLYPAPALTAAAGTEAAKSSKGNARACDAGASAGA